MSNKKEQKKTFQTCSLYIRYKKCDEVTEDNRINASDVSGIARMCLDLSPCGRHPRKRQCCLINKINHPSVHRPRRCINRLTDSVPPLPSTNCQITKIENI